MTVLLIEGDEGEAMTPPRELRDEVRLRRRTEKRISKDETSNGEEVEGERTARYMADSTVVLMVHEGR